MSTGTDAPVMKALTIRQPWATDIVQGFKTIEVRSRRTHHRGPLAIHAAASPEQGFTRAELADLPLGAVVGIVQVVDCRPLIPSDGEALDGDPTPLSADECAGMWAWVLADAEELPAPIPAKGYQNMWNVPEDLAMAIENGRAGT